MEPTPLTALFPSFKGEEELLQRAADNLDKPMTREELSQNTVRFVMDLPSDY